ncbi:AraC family transcriptional regulator [Cytophagaceae bacterium DM2B3-1]|uniref:AraC family transcriptional regulator n=1 Tax=Xanthocytophaga flava TaxID=3048013 RepID=A0ABT7CQI7_9BACT|nr:AraC family transcriptional regulator [Xanthocytophaga flavus]MDJ1495202.1 AraC family transcriptional regulator [Xanthocytophaga flavus]
MNLNIHSLPYDLIAASAEPVFAEGIHIVSYRAKENSTKNRVTLNQNLFSFLTEGQKVVSYSQKHARIDSSQFLLLSSGNCLMTEKLISEQGGYSSTLLFFDNKVLTDFFLKYADLFTRSSGKKSSDEPFVVFEKDDFLKNYITSLSLMLSASKRVPEEMAQLKFEEIMLYLANRFPEKLLGLRTCIQEDQSDFEIRKTVETHSENHVTIEELAFLCNMSVSTFKRRFTKLYGTSPNKWMLQRRMETAARLLQQAEEKPSDVYYKVGYENLSSFIQSFKQTFGVTPKEYQNQKLNV